MFLEGFLFAVMIWGNYYGFKYYFIPLAKVQIEKRRAKRHGPKHIVDKAKPKRDPFDIVM